MSDRDLILNTDPADSIQGHVGQNTKQVMTTLSAVPFSLEKLKLAGFEFLLRDQFGNHYHKMRAVLFDGEMYDVDQFIKPSMMMKNGGGFADLEDKAAKGRLRITEDLLQFLRDNAAAILARTNLELLKSRSLSTSPVAIETQDITHQANILEDALVAARQAAGDSVHDKPVAPDGFVPLKADKAIEPAKLAEAMPFTPDLTPKQVTLDTKL